MKQLRFLALLLIASCQFEHGFDETLEREKFLTLHRQQRAHHFGKDAASFAGQFSEQYISVNKGVIAQPDKAETIAKFERYFSSVEFQKWDDLSEPIIRFSEDGTMAYTVVDKIVELSYATEAGERVSDSTHFAWTAIYRKVDGNWVVDCVTSTEVPR